jgi:mono/diheme cytochrome c family protein
MTRTQASLTLACMVSACAGQVGGDSGWPVAMTPLELKPMEWNVAQADLGKIAAVTEDGDDVVVFGDHGATLLAGGAAAASDDSVTSWQAAARIPAADGSGFWAVGVDSDGKLYRLRAETELEQISDRYGLLADAVHSVAPMGTPFVAFSLSDAVAIADGRNVTRYDMPADRALAGDAHRVAAVAKDGSLRVLDVDKHAQTTLPIAAAIGGVFFQGQLLVQTKDALYSDKSGALTPVHQATADLHGLVVSGERVWFLQGKELCAAENAAIACAAADGVNETSSLFGSVSGDAWLLSDGALARYGVPAQGDEAVWRSGAFSVYARVCSSCHAPGGSSGVDLSSYPLWQKNRDMIYQQVVVLKSMPPDRALSDEDRATIASWAKPTM